MSISALVFVGVYAIGLLLAFARHPGYGVFAYLWVFYNHPPSRWWGAELPELRWSLIAAVVTLIAIAFNRDAREDTTESDAH